MKKIEINKDGLLSMERPRPRQSLTEEPGYHLVYQMCPLRDEDAHCGDSCPFFGEVLEGGRNADGSKLPDVLRLHCKDFALMGEIIDKRRT